MKEQTTMNPCVLNVFLTRRCQFFAQIGRMLVLDIFDNRLPTNGGPIEKSKKKKKFKGQDSYQLSLLTLSPYPGVSTMLRLRRTPFSLMTNYGVRLDLIAARTHTMADSFNLSCLRRRSVCAEATLAVDQMRCKNGIHQRGLAKAGLTCI